FLSKNPSFTPMLASLKQTFPDAHFIACTRDPAMTVPSQLSSLLPAANAMGIKSLPPTFVQNMLDVLKHYYHLINEHRHTFNIMIIDNAELCEQLHYVVSKIYQRFNMTLHPEFAATLQE